MTRIIRFVALAAVVLASSSCFADSSQTLVLSLEEPSMGRLSEKPAAQSSTSTAGSSSAASAAQSARVGRVGTVQVKSASIYMRQSPTSRKYSTVAANTPLAIVREEPNWYGVLMVNGTVGWIDRNAVRLTGYDLVAAKPAATRGTDASRGGLPTRPKTFGEQLIQTAMRYSGVSYVFGGTSPTAGMDCSAFVQSVFGKSGISLPRTSREQAQVGTSVPFDQLQPGDRLYFACKNPHVDHCGIYAGSGYFVHCSASRNGIGVDNLASDFFWRSLVVARRS